MYIGEYGQTFLLNIGEDISSATMVSIVFTRPDGTSFTRDGDDGVAIGSVDVLGGCNVTFNADEYLEYVFVSGDINQAGTWLVRSTIDIDGEHRIGAIDSFVIGE